MTAWTDARLHLERSQHQGFALRRRTSKRSRGTLFYIHGLGESTLCFERVMADPRLESWHHLAPDMMGYGKSDWTETPFDVERHAQSLSRLMDELDPQRPVTLVGHSMGGVIGLYLARLQTSRTHAVVNVEGNISPADCTGSAVAARQALAGWLEGGFFNYLQDLGRPVDETDPTQERAAVLRAYSASAHLCDPRTFHLNSRDLVRESATETLAQRLSALDLPQVYIHGSPRGTGPRSLDLLRAANIPLIALNDAGHWPYLDQHDGFIDALVEFLNARIP